MCFVEFHLSRFELCLGDKMEESFYALGQEELGISKSNSQYNANQTNRDVSLPRKKKRFKIKCIIPVNVLCAVDDVDLDKK